MAKRIPELLSALSEKGRLLEELLLVLEEERRCIVDRDLEGLDLQVSRKAELFAALDASKTRCGNLVHENALDLKVPDAQSLSPLIAKLEEPQREALQQVQRGLLDLGARLEKMLTSNADLLQGTLQTVTQTLDFFGRLFNNSKTYGYAGQMVGAGGASPTIICREA